MRKNLVPFLVLAVLILFSTCKETLDNGNGDDGGTETPTYAVSYAGNGNTRGSVPTSTVKYKEGQTVTVLGNTGSLAKTGNSYIGWNTKADGSGTSYVQGSTFVMGKSDVTLYAH